MGANRSMHVDTDGLTGDEKTMHDKVLIPIASALFRVGDFGQSVSKQKKHKIFHTTRDQ